MICSDLKQATKPYILVPSEQHRCPVGQDVTQNSSESQTHCVQQVIYLAVAVRYARHQIDQTDSSTLWYFTAQLICANYQIGQTDSSTFWHLTAYLYTVQATE